jgi:hypothetical protein
MILALKPETATRCMDEIVRDDTIQRQVTFLTHADIRINGIGSSDGFGHQIRQVRVSNLFDPPEGSKPLRGQLSYVDVVQCHHPNLRLDVNGSPKSPRFLSAPISRKVSDASTVSTRSVAMSIPDGMYRAGLLEPKPRATFSDQLILRRSRMEKRRIENREQAYNATIVNRERDNGLRAIIKPPRDEPDRRFLP